MSQAAGGHAATVPLAQSLLRYSGKSGCQAGSTRATQGEGYRFGGGERLFPWSGAGAAAGGLDDKAWTKRLCQSCGLPVSQVLMCTLSATLAEKIGQARSLSTATIPGTQISPPPDRTNAFPAPCIRLGDTAGGAGGNYPRATLSQTPE